MYLLSSHHYYFIHQTMRSLLGRLTASETPELIDKNGHLMATKIRTVQKNRKKMVTEELKAVIAERDTAVEKVNTALLLAFFLSLHAGYS